MLVFHLPISLSCPIASDVVLEADGHGLANPPLDVEKYLPASVDSENYGYYEDQKEIDS